MTPTLPTGAHSVPRPESARSILGLPFFAACRDLPGMNTNRLAQSQRVSLERERRSTETSAGSGPIRSALRAASGSVSAPQWVWVLVGLAALLPASLQAHP